LFDLEQEIIRPGALVRLTEKRASCARDHRGDMRTVPRFIRMGCPPKGEEPDADYTWWLDRWRPLDRDGMEETGCTCVPTQVEASKDPNDYRPITDGMELLFTDQAEWSIVCPYCYAAYNRMQWSGSTKGESGWRERAEQERLNHERIKGWCEFCDPIFGNGGWIS